MGLADANATKQSSVTTLDDEGDLRLEVGEGEARQSFVVCSKTLA